MSDPIDISAGLQPKQQQIDLSAGLQPKGTTPVAQPGALSRFGSNFAQMALPSTTLSDYWQGPLEAIRNPIESSKLLAGAIGQAQLEQLKQSWQSIQRAQAMNSTKATSFRDAAQRGFIDTPAEMLNAFGHGLAGSVPLIGPAAARAGEQLGSGDSAGGLGSAAGLLTPGALLKYTLARTGARVPAAPMTTEDTAYLSRLGEPTADHPPITPTAGEQVGPGFVQSTEKVAAKTAVAQSKTADFLANRQHQIGVEASKAREAILGGQQPVPPSDLTSGVQTAAASSIQQSSDLRDALNESRAQTLTGQPSLSPAEAGSRIEQAVNTINDSALKREGAVLQQVRQAADSQGIKVPYDQVSQLAETEYLRNEAAKQAGHAIYPPALEQTLYKMSGLAQRDSVTEQTFGPRTSYAELTPQMKNVVDGILKETPNEHPFGAAADARTSLLAETRRMERSGEINQVAKGAIEQLTKQQTGAMEQALPDELATPWKAAREGYRSQQEQIKGNQFLRELTRDGSTLKGENVVSQLLQKGNETDAAQLMNVLKNDPQTQAVLRRSAIDFIHDAAPDSKTALKLLDQRPGMRTILGDSYDQFRSSLEADRTREMSYGERAYDALMKRILNVPEPEKITDLALKSNAQAARIERLLSAQPEMGRQFGNDLFNHVLDNSTKNGPFGTKGAYFDPIKFASEYRAARPKLERFIDHGVLQNLDDFADGMSKLSFSHDVPLGQSGNIQANYKTLGTLGAFGRFATAPLALAAESIAAGSLAGHYGHPIIGTLMGLAGTLGPSAFVRLALSPTGSKVLSALSHMGVQNTSTAPLARGGYLATQAAANQPPQQ